MLAYKRNIHLFYYEGTSSYIPADKNMLKVDIIG